MLLGERGKFGGTVDVTGGGSLPLLCMCVFACLCFYFWVTYVRCIEEEGEASWMSQPSVLFMSWCVVCSLSLYLCAFVCVCLIFVCVMCRFC